MRLFGKFRLPTHGPSTSVHPVFVDGFVRKGYPHVKCALDCVLSSLTLSNEFANIWSHGLAAVWFLFGIWTVLCGWGPLGGDSPSGGLPVQPALAAGSLAPFIVQQTGCLVVMVGSTVAHTFHSLSAWHHQFWFMVDYLSISFYTLSSAIAHYAYSRPLDPTSGPIAAFSANGYLAFALTSHFCVFLSQTAVRFKFYRSKFRVYVLVLGYVIAYIVNFLPFLSRYYSAGERHESDQFHWGQFYWSAASAVVTSTKIPERFVSNPNMFYILHAHALMHIGIVASLVCQRQALALESQRWQQIQEVASQPGIPAMLAVLLAYASMGALSCYLCGRYVIKDVQAKSANGITQNDLTRKRLTRDNDR